MKGIILSGGTGSRLYPCTKVTNKHLLPVFNKPMVYYPLNTLVSAGITDVMIVSGTDHADHFKKLFAPASGGDEFAGVQFSFAIQEHAGGIAQALGLCREFAGNEKIAVILGDNIFEDDITGAVIAFDRQDRGAKIFLKRVSDPQRFGVAEINGDSIVAIEEKPVKPKSDLAVTGLYFYDPQVWDVITSLKPSGRGELEITDVNNFYVKQGSLSFDILQGDWTDAGTFHSLLRANLIAARAAGHDISDLI